jgi:hypothetical protein
MASFTYDGTKYIVDLESSWQVRKNHPPATALLVHIGAYGGFRFISFAKSFDDALENAADYLLETGQIGYFATESVNDEYNRLIQSGMSEEEAYEQATVDTMSVDSGNHYLLSWEVLVTTIYDGSVLYKKALKKIIQYQNAY